MLAFPCVVFHLIIFSVSGDTSPPPYTPTDYILIDCGSSSNNSTFSDGRNWTGDSLSKFSPSNIKNISSSFVAANLDPTAPRVPYMTARIFNTQFTYTFPLSTGQKFVRLYFYPDSYSHHDKTKSFFSVKANNYTLLSNFSAFLFVSAIKPPVSTISREFLINILDTQRLVLTFTPNPNSFAFINGIEIVSMPSSLYREDVPVPLVGTNYLFQIDSQTAMETSYRLNVGGSSLDIDADTGMFRLWDQDDTYLDGASRGQAKRFYLPIKYTKPTPAYTAPEKVYTTARITNDNETTSKLTWIFPVHSGFYYLLRLHFCEPEVTDQKPWNLTNLRKGKHPTRRNPTRLFTINISNSTAEMEAKVIKWSEKKGIPVYKDYVVFVTDRDGRRSMQSLWVELHPNLHSTYAAILNGLEIFKLNQTDGSLAGLNPAPEVTSPSRKSPQKSREKGSTTARKRRIKIFIGILAGVGGPVLLFVIILFAKRMNDRKKEGKCDNHDIAAIISIHGSLTPTRYTYSTIKKMTNSFADKLGEGGFGTVYKGKLSDGRLVAVKVLIESKDNNGEEFINEVVTISRCSHVNVVSLLGFCYERTKRALIYNYMPNGSLDKFIGSTKSSKIEHHGQWQMLYQIAVGTARGLDYLHQGCNTRILHLDIKPQNILLDEDFCPKISDFGLAKLCPQRKQSIVSMQGMRGTVGYIAPEIFSRNFGGVSHKSDVYSYGMTVLEMVGVRNKVSAEAGEFQTSEIYFPNSIYDCDDQPITKFEGFQTDEEENLARKMILISLWCIQTKPSDRPSMSKVVEMLEGSIESLEIPPKPIMCSPPRLLQMGSTSTLETSTVFDAESLI